MIGQIHDCLVVIKYRFKNDPKYCGYFEDYFSYYKNHNFMLTDRNIMTDNVHTILGYWKCKKEDHVTEK